MTVDATATPVIASRLTVLAGRGIDVAAAPEPTPDEDQLPAVWIPDSTAWLRRVQQVDRAAFAEDARSVASSPVVVAMPGRRRQRGRLATAAAGRRTRAHGQRVAQARHGRAAAGDGQPGRRRAAGRGAGADRGELPALVRTFRGVVKTAATAELLPALGSQASAGPAAEQAVYAYNSTNPRKLVAVQLDPPAAARWTTRTRSGPALPATSPRRPRCSGPRCWPRAEALARHAFRTPDGDGGRRLPGSTAARRPRPPARPSTTRPPSQRALGLWSAANSPSRTLALFDVTVVDGHALGGRSRPATS